MEHVARFARHFGRSPALLGPEEIRADQVYLTNDKQLAPASLVITVAALRSLYTVTLQKTWSVEAVIPAPKRPQTLPVVLSPAEVVQFLDCVAAPIACRPGFFLPVRVLSRFFRRLFLEALQEAFDDGQLRFAASRQTLADPQGVADHVQPTRETEWVVYAKPPFAGPQAWPLRHRGLLELGQSFQNRSIGH